MGKPIAMDFTTTATDRPEILDKCYGSFYRNLLDVDWKNCTLYINIDPIPKINRRTKNNIISCFHMLCNTYFGKVVINVPDTPNYTQAYKWCYSNAQSKLIFNLEDDFELLRPISIYELVNPFLENKGLYAASLRCYHYSYKSICTSPQVLHKRFYKPVGEGLDPNFNPEVQLRGRKWGLEMPTFRPEYGPKIPNNGKFVMVPSATGHSNVIIKDLARKWLSDKNYKKPNGEKKYFTTWEEK